MITIEQRIKMIAEGLGVNYYFGDWQRINVAGDTGRIDFPLIAYLRPPSGTVNLSGPGVRETENGVLAFLGLTVFDFEANENNEIVQDMKELMIRFVGAVNASGEFKPIGGNIRYDVVYDKLDFAVTGVTVSLALQEAVGKCV